MRFVVVSVTCRMKSVSITAKFNIGTSQVKSSQVKSILFKLTQNNTGTGGAIPVVTPKGTGGGSGVTAVGAVSKLGSNEDVANIFRTAISY